MSEQKTIIGYYHLKEDTIFTNTYECAAWYEKVKVPAGVYPVCVPEFHVDTRRDGSKEVRGFINSAYVTMDGIITDDYFGTLFYGVPVGTYDKDNSGKPSSHTMGNYLYAIADSILHDENTPWELLPEYEARDIHFTYDGEEHTTHGIFVKD